ncbi:hypothetical protein [Aurantivibrio infirmus]
MNMNRSTTPIRPLKLSLSIVLLLIFFVQSVSALADIHQTHQSGSDHLTFEHSQELSSSLELKNNHQTELSDDLNFHDHQIDEPLALHGDIEQGDSLLDCHHCCHCHGVHVVMVLTDHLLIVKPVSISLQDFYHRGEYLSPIEPSFRPPRT